MNGLRRWAAAWTARSERGDDGLSAASTDGGHPRYAAVLFREDAPAREERGSSWSSRHGGGKPRQDRPSKGRGRVSARAAGGLARKTSAPRWLRRASSVWCPPRWAR